MSSSQKVTNSRLTELAQILLLLALV